LPIAAVHERLSRREVLALTLLAPGLAFVPLPTSDAKDQEIVVVLGWVLRRADLSQL
jgi:hypothetical protein